MDGPRLAGCAISSLAAQSFPCGEAARKPVVRQLSRPPVWARGFAWHESHAHQPVVLFMKLKLQEKPDALAFILRIDLSQTLQPGQIVRTIIGIDICLLSCSESPTVLGSPNRALTSCEVVVRKSGSIAWAVASFQASKSFAPKGNTAEKAGATAMRLKRLPSVRMMLFMIQTSTAQLGPVSPFGALFVKRRPNSEGRTQHPCPRRFASWEERPCPRCCGGRQQKERLLPLLGKT